MRCFIAFELDEDCRERLRVHVEPFANRLVREMGWPVRMVPPANWHQPCLVFKDLADTERATVWEEVQRNVEAGVWSDLMFAWDEPLRLWPTPRKPSLICLAAQPTPEPAGWPLIQRLEQAPFNKGELDALRVYRPQITLIHFRGGAVRPYWREWQAMGDRVPRVPASSIRFNRVSLILSDVSPTKPIYTREYTARLKSKISLQTMLRRPQSLLLEE
jgi:2'-5' RNA ligase